MNIGKRRSWRGGDLGEGDICHAHARLPEAMESNPAWPCPETVAAPDPCSRSSIQRNKCRKGKRELSHPQLSPRFHWEESRQFLGPLPRDKIGDENIYLFLRLQQSQAEKPTLAITYCSSAASKAGPPHRQPPPHLALGEDVPLPHWVGGKSGIPVPTETESIK